MRIRCSCTRIPEENENENEQDEQDENEENGPKEPKKPNDPKQFINKLPLCYYNDIIVKNPEWILSKFTGVKMDLRDPTKVLSGTLLNQTASKYEKLFVALNTEDYKAMTNALKDLNMIAAKFDLFENIGLFYTQVDPKSTNKVQQGTQILWRFDSNTDPLIFTAPHEKPDGALSAAMYLFLNTKAKVLMINNIDPFSGRGQDNNGKSHYNTDGAHSRETIFYKNHISLNKLYPNAFFIQLHGIALDKQNQFRNGLGGYGPAKTNYPKIFQSTIKKYFKPEEYLFFLMCALGPNSGGTKRRGCGLYSIEADLLATLDDKKDSGRFMHWEIGKNWRTDVKSLKRFAMCFNETMMSFGKTDDIMEEEIVDSDCEDCG